jgi:mRNA-degrading endonuclease toxin of MazEF toxin-antitoxin module
MPNAKRGEVWQVDLGMAAKARPAVIFNVCAVL